MEICGDFGGKRKFFFGRVFWFFGYKEENCNYFFYVLVVSLRLFVFLLFVYVGIKIFIICGIFVVLKYFSNYI